jgi:citrate lyase beta subunit
MTRRPTVVEVAQRTGGSASSADGRFVDEAVLRQARRTLDLAGDHP